MLVLPAHSLVFTLPAQLFVCLLSPHGALLERVVVHCRCFQLLQCTPRFLRLLPLFSSLGELSGKKFVFPPADIRLHSLMSSLKIPVCSRRLIPFDIIMALEIVWTTALANYLPFSKFSISQARVSTGSYGPIILTAF